MRNSTRWFGLIVGAGLIILLLVGMFTVFPVFAQGPGGMMGGYGSGWMGRNPQNPGQTAPFGSGGMMGNFQNGPGWMMGGGMQGMMLNSNSPFFTAEPLTLAETTEILAAYLSGLNDTNLKVEDIMIFDNHAYAEIIERDSGIGVMEVLVDPVTRAVYPEMGPNMMWNQKYGMMSGFGGYGMMGGGMMRGRFGFGNANPAAASVDMPITPAKAVELAQTYLAANFNSANLTADDHAEPFYGYYTLHVKRDGQTVGMLSVNGYTGQVFPHTWHGKLLEMGGE